MAAAFAPAVASWPRKARLEAVPQPEPAAPRRAAQPEERQPDRPRTRARLASSAKAAPPAASAKMRLPWRPSQRTDPCQTRPTRGARRRRRASGASAAPRAARAPWPALSRPARPARPELAVPQAAREPARAARPVLLVARPALWAASPERSSALAARPASPAAVAERRAGRGRVRRGRRPSSRQHRPRRRGSPRACRPWRVQPCSRSKKKARAAVPRRPASGTARSRTGPPPGPPVEREAAAQEARRAARRVVSQRLAALAARVRRPDRAQRTPAPPRLRAAGFPSCRQTDRRR